MTPAQKGQITRALQHVRRCRGCGGWRWDAPDRVCVTCVVAGKRRQIAEMLGVTE